MRSWPFTARCSNRREAALGFSLTLNHPFVDGNKRVAHAAMEVFLILNGHEIVATMEDQEQLMLALAAGQVTRDALITWLERHIKPVGQS